MQMMIKELGEIITGNTPSKKIERFWNSDDICFVKPDIIADNGITEIYESNEYISEEARQKARVALKDAILVTCIGSIGKIGITADGEYAFNQQINAIIPNEKVNSKYLAYNLLFNKPRLIAIANAPVVPIINKSQFGDFFVSIEENIDKQVEIVKVLDKLTSIIEQRKNELFTLDDLIRARFVEMFGEEVYPVSTLIDLICEGAGLSYGIVQPGDDGTGNMGVLRPVDIVDGKISEDSIKYIDRTIGDGFKKTELTGEELLVTVRGTTGITALTDDRFAGMNVTRGIAVIRYNFKKINPIYLNAYLNTDESQRYIQEHTRGATLKQINLSDLRTQEIPVPPMEQQKEFAAFVLQVDKSKAVVQKSLEETQLLFDSLMQKYFGD